MTDADNKTTALVPAAAAQRGIELATWNALTTSIYPGAKLESVLLAHDYCTARKLDPLKKPVHIVPMRVKDSKTNKYEWRDVIMPGIYEARMTAARTGQYAGQDDPVFGPNVDYKGIDAPEWCKVTVYRIVAGQRCPFSHTEYFAEAVVEKKDKDDEGGNTGTSKPNAMWTKRPRGQLAKCAEAGALRKAFPEELGGVHVAEEMEGRTLDDVTHDMGPAEVIPVPRAKTEAAAPAAPTDAQPRTTSTADAPKTAPAPQNGAPVSEGQIRLIRAKLAAGNIPEANMLAAFQVADITALKASQANQVLDWIKHHGAQQS